MTSEELKALIEAAVTREMAPLKARVEALGRPVVPDPARDAQRRVAIDKFMVAYAEGRLVADHDTVQ